MQHFSSSCSISPESFCDSLIASSLLAGFYMVFFAVGMAYVLFRLRRYILEHVYASLLVLTLLVVGYLYLLIKLLNFEVYVFIVLFIMSPLAAVFGILHVSKKMPIPRTTKIDEGIIQLYTLISSLLYLGTILFFILDKN